MARTDTGTLTGEQKYDLLTKDFLERDGDTFVRIRRSGRLGWEDTLPRDSAYSAAILSPKDGRELLLNAVKLARQMITAMDTPWKVDVRVDASRSCTDSRVVYVATKVLDDEALPLGRRLDAFLGLAVHEGSHLLYTDFGLQARLGVPNQTVRGLRNILEDEMIERRLGERKPGLANFLAATKYYYFGRFEKEAEEVEPNPATRLFNALLKMVRYPAALTRGEIDEFADELLEARRILTPYPEDTAGCVAKADELFELFRRFLRDERRRRSDGGRPSAQGKSREPDGEDRLEGQEGQGGPDGEDGGQESQGDPGDGQEGQEGGSAGNARDGGSGDPGEGDCEDGDRSAEDPGEDGDSGEDGEPGQDGQDGGNARKDTEDGDGPEDGNGEDTEDGKDRDGNGDGDGNDEAEDGKGGGSGDPGEGDGEDEDGSENGDGSDEDSGKDGDSDEDDKDGQDGEDGEDTESSGEGSRNGTEGDGSDGMDGDDGSEGPEDPDDPGDMDGEDGDDGQEDPGDMDGMDDGEPVDDGEVEAALREIVGKVLEELTGDPTEPGENPLEESDMCRAALRGGHIGAMEAEGLLEIGETPDTLTIRKDPDEAKYRESLARVRRHVPAIAAALRQNGTSYTYNMTGMRTGLLDTNKLCEARQGVPTVYTRKGEVRSDEINVALLVDESGSMCGKRERLARDTAVLIAEAAAGVPNLGLYVYGYTSGIFDEGCRDRCLLFPYMEGRPGDRRNLGAISADGGTPTAHAIAEAVSRIRRATDRRTLLFVVSDGWSDEGCDAVRAACGRASADGFDVIGISVASDLGPDALRAMYDRWVDMKDAADLAHSLARCVKDAVLRSTRKGRGR